MNVLDAIRRSAAPRLKAPWRALTVRVAPRVKNSPWFYVAIYRGRRRWTLASRLSRREALAAALVRVSTWRNPP